MNLPVFSLNFVTINSSILNIVTNLKIILYLTAKIMFMDYYVNQKSLAIKHNRNKNKLLTPSRRRKK